MRDFLDRLVLPLGLMLVLGLMPFMATFLTWLKVWPIVATVFLLGCVIGGFVLVIKYNNYREQLRWERRYWDLWEKRDDETSS